MLSISQTTYFISFEGVLSGDHDNQAVPSKNLCALCKNQDRCLSEFRTQHLGAMNALQCLSDGTADVAFVRHIDVFRYAGTDGVSNPNDLRILCGDGQRKGDVSNSFIYSRNQGPVARK